MPSTRRLRSRQQRAAHQTTMRRSLPVAYRATARLGVRCVADVAQLPVWTCATVQILHDCPSGHALRRKSCTIARLARFSGAQTGISSALCVRTRSQTGISATSVNETAAAGRSCDIQGFDSRKKTIARQRADQRRQAVTGSHVRDRKQRHDGKHGRLRRPACAQEPSHKVAGRASAQNAEQAGRQRVRPAKSWWSLLDLNQ